MKPAQNDILIELHVDDFNKVKDFYGSLGFEVIWEREPEDFKGYLVLKRGNCILCFWGGNEKIREQKYFKQFPQSTKRGYAVEIVIIIEDIESFYTNVSRFVKISEHLTHRAWGLRDFRIEDPFGFYIRFTEPHNILDPGNAVP